MRLTIQVVKLESHEADDVVATLVGQVLQKGFRVVIASPDKDFKQLISEDVQIVVPVPNLNRWSFYTLKHYRAQYNCDPQSDLSLSKSCSFFVPLQFTKCIIVIALNLSLSKNEQKITKFLFLWEWRANGRRNSILLCSPLFSLGKWGYGGQQVLIEGLYQSVDLWVIH